MNDMVSIITPSYNTAEFIGKTIQSVLCQTYKNWEMIIVDDHSEDNTDKVVSAFLSDDRIHFFKNEKNYGAAACRNFALKEAKGKWVAFLDSDDLWQSDKLEKQIDFMNKNQYHFSYTAYNEIDEEGYKTGILRTGPKKIGKLTMTMFNFMGCLTVMYDREYIGLVQVADLKKRNDYAIWIKAVKKCPAYYLDQELASYRVRKNGSIMNRDAGTLSRMKYNYLLWRMGENKNIVTAGLLTGVNFIFGAFKKLIYKRHI